ncbi:Cytochrome P450 monooxygenase TRI13 [Apiospora aurea]|uniref:Cytochrome P450 monooxygenase TRI13 n=1 Tax=Apiospora aurea TaxID=335848 RepID=A0ABR1QJ34_9PEZI
MSTLLYLSAVCAVVLYVAYLRLLPRPTPGIPYHKHSAKRLFGDLPDYVASYRKHGEFYQYRHESVKKLGFPMYQFFMTPLSKPLVVLEDPREVEDICLRRNREFDRAPLTSNILGVVMPHSSIVKKTGPAWRAQRKPWLSVMAPDFLRRVVGPSLHEATLELVELWRTKAASVASSGEVADFINDFDIAALDAIWVAILGEKLNGLRDQINAARPVTGVKKGETGGDDGEKADSIDMQNTMRYMNHAALSWRTFKFPPLQLWLMKRSAEYRRFHDLKSRQIQRIMKNSIAKFQDALASGVEAPDSCAMDLVLRREVQDAHKAGTPLRDLAADADLCDEIFLLLWAGHDTTSNTLSWWVKYMSRYQEVQTKLRASLEAAFPITRQDGQQLPTVEEILDADIPYLDAAMEETLRLSTITTVARQAVVDTEILGCRIPKGTQIATQNLLYERPVAVSEELRSATSRTVQGEKRTRGGFDGPAGDNLQDFVPERWLVPGDNGEMAFDAYALPRTAFGDGPRGCFGRRLAMHELKIMMTLTTLCLKFARLPEDLDNMRANETLFRKPVNCFARLEVLREASGPSR